MPGERLMCVWEAVWAEDSNTPGNAPPKDLVKAITKYMAASSKSVRYTNDKFDQAFKQPTVPFDAYKKYVLDNLKERGIPMSIMEEEIERLCWERSKKTYPISATSVCENEAQKLWQIFNRLTVNGSYPPVVLKSEAQWFGDKLAQAVQRNVGLASFQSTLPDRMKFSEFLGIVDEHFLSKVTKDVQEKTVEDLHSWLVKEICMAGWLHKRTRKQANWTNWVKRWFILMPGKLSYYESPQCKDKKGEVSITSHSKLEELTGKSGSFMGRKMLSRFRVTNAPYLEIEMSSGNEQDKKSWVAAIEEVISTSRLGTTPVLALLQERHAQLKMGKPLKETEDRLNSMRKTAIHNRQVKDGEVPDRKSKKASMKRQPTPATSHSNGVAKSTPQDAIQEESDGDTDEEVFDNNTYMAQRDKIKLVFGRFDTDGNGFIDRQEFQKFVKELGLFEMDPREMDLVFNTIDKNKTGKLTLDDFTDYFVDFVMEESGSTESVEARLRNAFLKADRDGTGTVDFKEFTEFAWERKRSVRVSMLIKAFKKMDKSSQGEISYDQFRKYFQHEKTLGAIVEEDEDEDSIVAKTPTGVHCSLETYLKRIYDESDIDGLADYLRNRWQAFASFKRYGASGNVVMAGGHGIVADITPGNYSLVDLACFSDLPPVKPKYVVTKVTWFKGNGTSGKLVFPADFNVELPVDIATNEHLRYYDCSFADSNQVKVSLLYRHGIQDFTYQNNYMDDYVRNSKMLGGSGIERHEFSHLDCPLDEDSGHFILAKFIEDTDEMHITAFKVPTRHTLYVPSNVIHSNDYLKGTWRTMLSDEAEIDHVHLVKRHSPSSDVDDVDHFTFQFRPL